MAKFKFTLGALPDFKLPVSFNMPNGEEGRIVFTVKHKTAAEIQELFQKGAGDKDFVMELAVGWDIADDEFNEENVERLINYYPGSMLALTQAYMKALAGQRVKN
ncbi:tail length tape measure protein [Escherichia phage vB_EcoS_IME347]|uniref:Tape measure chaperone n=1 Tax=Escherichia phage vB_EcoS_IME347 TaxID=2496546 RepID=A0A2S1GS67_9CAUD|nr:tail length tape measure protein [Escherichia phage vB_EcoS_IME347]AWD92245.1 tape measure chaperone [Escherichia phage vB_EcoS_IME347]